jgi:hypothetical protein
MLIGLLLCPTEIYEEFFDVNLRAMPAGEHGLNNFISILLLYMD